MSGCPAIDQFEAAVESHLGYWRVDDGMGSSVAYDSSGRGNEGALHGVDASKRVGRWPFARGARARARRLGAGAVLPIDLESAVGAEGWGTALSRQTGAGNNQHYHIALHSEAQPSLFLITVDGYALIRPAETVPMGVWTHLAGVYDGAVARLYVNGVEAGSQPLTGRFGADTTPVILGGNGNDDTGVPTELFPGRIDELMLYARALSATEIGQLAAGALFSAGSRDAGSD